MLDYIKSEIVKSAACPNAAKQQCGDTPIYRLQNDKDRRQDGNRQK
jgi:hypothetical protein